MKNKDLKMFKKTLLAAALMTATTAFAGDITISGTAYKVGNEYLGAYTGTALSGDLETGSIGITYRAGIALGVDNTLKFEFAGGVIAADTGLVLVKAASFATNHADEADIETDIDTALAAVTDTGVDATDTAALKAAAIAVINAAIAADPTVEATDYIAAINALNVSTYALTTTAIDTTVRGAEDIFTNLIPASTSAVADLVDFGVDANGDYQWVLFKVTDATVVSDIVYFNDTNSDGAANVVTKFTKATIGSGDLTVALTEAKDSTSADLSAPVAAAKTLVTTADQLAVTLTVAEDTIDVEQERLFFSDGTGDAVTSDFVFDVTVDTTIDLGLNVATATFEGEVAGTMTGVDSIDYVETVVVGGDDSAALDVDNLIAGTGISDATISITVDGTTNLATRTLTYTLEITPDEAETDAFTLVTTSNAFVWDLNGSEVTFPYAPIGYDHISTNFEIANSGTQEGDILISAFDTAGNDYSATIPQAAEAGKLTKVSEGDIMTAFGLTAGTKVSITFTTTAPASDIKVTGYSNLNDTGRMTLLSDAYEGNIN